MYQKDSWELIIFGKNYAQGSIILQKCRIVVKKSELKRLVEEYNLLKSKKPSKYNKAEKRLQQIAQRYFHETGRSLKSDSDRT